MAKWKVASLLAPVILVSILTLAGCGGRARGAVYVRTPPPPPIRETFTTSPGPEYVWIEGHYEYRGDSYVWGPGRWERRPLGRRDWVPGHWKETGRGWIWVEGHWR